MILKFVTEFGNNYQVRESLTTLSPIVMQLYTRVVVNDKLRRQWQPSFSGPAVERLPNTASTYVAKLRESWQHLLRDRAARSKYALNCNIFYSF